MHRFIRLPLAGAACLLMFGCQSDSVSPQESGPMYAVSDGAHNGNPDFFFLPPLFKNPNTDPNYEPAGSNPNLKPAVEICELGPPAADLTRQCIAGPPLKRFNPSAITYSDQQYQVNWKTDDTPLNVSKFYRINVLVGTALLGFADVDPVSSGRDLKNVQTNEYIPLLDGRTLPIKFRIENGALCAVDGTPCASETINLASGGGVELLGGGEDFKFDIPPGTTATFGGQAVSDVTFNLEVCSGIDVDLPKVGACLRVSTFFDAPGGTGELVFSQPILISLCVLNGEVYDPDETRQQGLLTLHQQDGTVIRALPHAQPNCSTIGMSFWDRVKNLAARVFEPRPAMAASRNALLHVGGGGETDRTGVTCPPAGSAIVPKGMFLIGTCPPSSPIRRVGPQRASTAAITPPHTVSDFQFALPAMMDFVDPDDASRSAPPGTSLPTAVKVTDWDGNAVQGAHVTFVEPVIEGPPTIVGTATSNSDGIAQISWLIENGSNTVVATGRGIAAQNNYPGATVKPFMPDISLPTNQQEAVFLGTGRVTFLATGQTETFPATTVLRGLNYPTGLWMAGSDAYLTETAGRNTSFGGKITLLHWTPDGGGSVFTLLTNPVNSDAVVLDSDGRIYLASYVGSTPGQQGRVSRVVSDIDVGWIETPVTDVAVAAHDMFMDGNDDIYLIGSSDSPDATNLYRLAAGAYDVPQGLATGLGRSRALTKVGSAIYYGVADEIHRIDDGIDERILTHGSAIMSLTSDGTYLYFGDLGGTIRRFSLNGDVNEELTSGPGEITNVRYEPISGRLYYLRSGTAAAEYTDGTLSYITVNTPIP